MLRKIRLISVNAVVEELERGAWDAFSKEERKEIVQKETKLLLSDLGWLLLVFIALPFIPLIVLIRKMRAGHWLSFFTSLLLVLGLILPAYGADTVRITDFGAIANDSSDDTAAINAAKNSGARKVIFPPGVFELNAPVCPAVRQIWEGFGKEGVTVLYQNAPNTDLIQCRDSDGVVIRSMELKGNGGGIGSGLVVTSDNNTAADNVFEHLHINNHGLDCARFEGTYRLILNNIQCGVAPAGRDGFRFGPSNPGSLAISNTTVSAYALFSKGVSAGNYNFRLGVSTGAQGNGLTGSNRFNGLTSDANAGNGVEVVAHGDVIITGAHMEGQGIAFRFAGSGMGPVICIGCRAVEADVGFLLSQQAVHLYSPTADTTTTPYSVCQQCWGSLVIGPVGSLEGLQDTSGRVTVLASQGGPVNLSGDQINKGNVSGVVGNTTRVVEKFKNTQGVSAQGALISEGADELTLVYVYGKNSVAGDRFFDMVLAKGGLVAPVVLFSHSAQGEPQARTYSMSGPNLQLAMASGTYNVSTVSLLFPRPD